MPGDLGQLALATEETFYWSTLVLGITLVAVLILFFFKMFISPRQVLVSLEKASSGILILDPAPGDAATLPEGKARPGRSTAGTGHNWHRHLTLSLGILSTVLGFMLGWEFQNNIYAQEWLAQNLQQVTLIALVVVLGVILLPLAMIILVGFLAREKKPPARGEPSRTRTEKP